MVLRARNLDHSIRRDRNDHDNAGAETVFNLLKRAKGPPNVQAGQQNMFGFIEMPCNPKRKHARNQMALPIDLKRQQKLKH